MTKTNRLLSLFAAMLFSATMMADDPVSYVKYEPLEVSEGFNRDVIAECYPMSTSCVISYLQPTGYYYCMGTESVIRSVNNAYQIDHPNYFSNDNLKDIPKQGWPDNYRDTIKCVEDAKDTIAYQDVVFLLAPYDQPNVLTMRPDNCIGETGALKFKKVGCYNKVFFLLVSAFEGSRPSVRNAYATIHYTDGTSSVEKVFEFAGLSGKTHHNVRKVNIYENMFKKWSKADSGKAYAAVFDMDVDPTKLIDRIAFRNSIKGTAVMIFAVTGRTADIAAPAEESTEIADIQNHQFTISWDGVPTAETYRVDVATDEDFQHMVEGYNNQLVTKNDTIVTGLEEDEDYYWRVRAVNADGGQSASSAVRRVRTAGSNPPETSETSTDIEEMLKGYAGFRAVVPSIKIHRTLCRNGYFNTLCLPFSMNAEQIAASPIAGVRVFEFVSAEKTGSGLDIVISGPIDHIDAGVPYLVNWVPTTPEWIGEDGLVFENVNITTYKGDTIGDNEHVQFIGNIGIASMVELDENNLFLGANNTLYYPEGDYRLRGFRSYFKIPSTGAQAVARHTPARIVMQKNTPTDIEAIGEGTKGEWRKVLRDGHLIILRGDKEYNAQGQRVK